MKVSCQSISLIISFILSICLCYNYWPKNQQISYCKKFDFQAKESILAHLLLDHLEGIEIGGSLHNPFCLNTINVDFTNDTSTSYKQAEIRVSNGTYLPVDIVAPGDKLPFANETYDFVISSHAIEHFIDPIKVIEEWFRIIRKGGYIFMIIPHKERTFDKANNRTTLNELVARHENPDPNFIDNHGHHSFWITEDVMELCKNRKWKVVAMLDIDDKVGNGFTIVLQK